MSSRTNKIIKLIMSGDFGEIGLKLGRRIDYLLFKFKYSKFWNEYGNKKRTGMSWKRIVLLDRLARKVCKEKIVGNYVEFGVWRGGSLYIVANIWKKLDKERMLFGFDSFEGLPHPNRDMDGDKLKKGLFDDTDYDEVVRFFKEKELNNIKIYKGWFESTISNIKNQRLSLCLIDADVYESIKLVLEKCYHIVSKGGYILIDDYRHPFCPGATIATEEFFADKEENINIEPGYECSCWIKKL